MTHLEKGEALPDRSDHLSKTLANHTLWVCFLDEEGYELFTDAQYTAEGIISVDETVPKQLEVSTIQFWHNDERVTVLPTGYSDDGTLLYTTIEGLLEQGQLPTFVAHSLARRLKKQPYRDDPESAIYPLLQLLPDDSRLIPR